ncbi:DUF2155 domain-containing protein [Marinibaculum pumilum]|uniref:DUF2155 domain-containing protein n=1 Tax=Marinibaculum pumilum TaxID=1766165 RepID=A0ABV7KYM5_9PROT
MTVSDLSRLALSTGLSLLLAAALVVPAGAQQATDEPLRDGTGQAGMGQEGSEAPLEELEMIPGQVARLQTLDKISARISTIEVPVGGTVAWERLDISVAKCARSSPFERPERAALLKIAERRRGLAPVEVFSGWMFASSPALHAMEHPVYDVLVVDCMSWSAAEGGPAGQGGGSEGAPKTE